MLLFGLVLFVIFAGLLLSAYAKAKAHKRVGGWTVLIGVLVFFMMGVFMIHRDVQATRIEDHTRLILYLAAVDVHDDAQLSVRSRIELKARIHAVNSSIAHAKEYNGGLIDIWIVDELVTLESIVTARDLALGALKCE